MITDVERIATIERANYVSMQSMGRAVPFSKLILRDDVILTSAHLFPTVDMNHACLLRSTSDTIESLVDEVVHYFKSRRLPVNVFVSPACTPATLADQLLRKGFQIHEQVEAWIMIEDLRTWQPPTFASPEVMVREVDKSDARDFAKAYLAAFGMLTILAPITALLFKRSIGLPDVHYYLASVQGELAGICLWHAHDDLAYLGGTGVLPSQRGKKVASTMVIQALLDAQQQGIMAIAAQTVQEGLENYMCTHGFRRVFTRTRYVL